ncbi:GTP-binding protein Era [Thioalkalivibrio nitratireducens DSM 14787]|uniref:GTPase Era n=1 Tax=Thioalkalivibrio nitratireducens (strain DSM 14787 / UNIQEM 213 / ALEN2) TaxID=1255043 RepID=L0DSC8_THIND|nr:GTPase Era [Thioalkalivibrio nitratireducens]AGA32519.1 GTP-binding protein Era [Thioalkalivibrio nitratireducens DSM 14787]
MTDRETNATRCGLVALVGRPNVGKTTLMNRMVGEKLAAITRKPHTTRHRILGIVTQGADQMVLMDTPGIDVEPRKRMNQLLTRTAVQALGEADVVCFIVEALRFDAGDEHVLRLLQASGRPALLVVNKVDRVADKSALLPFIDVRALEYDYLGVVPLSGRTGQNLQGLVDELRRHLPPGPFLYDPDQLSDRSERFRAEEMIREALLERLGQEVPYAVAVRVEGWEDRPGITHIDALILVERDSQKGIVIGKGGHMLKRVGQAAREQLEALLGRKIMLRLTVRVEAGWPQSERALRELGIDETR